MRQIDHHTATIHKRHHLCGVIEAECCCHVGCQHRKMLVTIYLHQCQISALRTGKLLGSVARRSGRKAFTRFAIQVRRPTVSSVGQAGQPTPQEEEAPKHQQKKKNCVCAQWEPISWL